MSQKKTLRLKKSSAQEHADGTEEDSSTPEPVPAVMGRAGAAVVKRKSGSTVAAILALVATLLFASLVFVQYRELQACKYAFPRPTLQEIP